MPCGGQTELVIRLSSANNFNWFDSNLLHQRMAMFRHPFKNGQCLGIPYFGALAQMARAPALQAGCQEFESLMLHQDLCGHLCGHDVRINDQILETDDGRQRRLQENV